MKVVLEDPYIPLSEKKISSMRDLVPLLEATVQSQRPLLIVAEGIVPGGGVALLRAQ